MPASRCATRSTKPFAASPLPHAMGPSTAQRPGPARESALAPGQIDPAVADLRRANPHRFRDVRTGHLAVVAMAGRPWFIGRVCEVSPVRGSRTPGFVQVINVDDGEPERIPAPWIVELFSEADRYGLHQGNAHGTDGTW